MMRLWVLLSWLCACVMVIVADVSDVTCDSGQTCPDQTTCCEMANKKYGCCPMPSAVCCSDKIHCCPSGSKCDVSKGTCLQADNVLRFFSRGQAPTLKTSPATKMEPRHPKVKPVIVSEWEAGLPMEEFRPKATECPDGETQCPSTSTCCMLKSGLYGCCDGENSVCCSDGLHCCPQGYTCDEKRGACTSASKGLTFRWVDKKPVFAHPVPKVDANLTCADRKTVCQQNDTCCNATKDYGCCPLAHAVCCLDRQHCCPTGTKCDIPHRRCYREEDGWEEPWTERRGQEASTADKVRESLSRVVDKDGGVTCQDGQMCQDGQTCCLMKSGSYGCCGYPDVSGVTPSKLTESALVSLGDIDCPDGSKCPSSSTCCEVPGGSYGCCPQEQAVCCSDGVHCCPQGYKCDLSAGKCEKTVQEYVSPTSLHSAAVGFSGVTESSVTCPDGSECPDDSTCCKMSSGQAYGCCRLPNAVCCSDGVHCCPSGYKCDLQEQKCSKGPDSVTWSEKQPSVKGLQVQKYTASVVCPGGMSQCPTGQTCCKLASGEWGCCPMPQAVCCKDGVHCCPSGYTCETGGCKKGDDSVAWVEKQPAQRRPEVPKYGVSVVCPGGTAQCAAGQTCCRLASGQWGCCPLPQAVCCSDGAHCCPSGYTCESGDCKKGEDSVPWMKKQPAQKRPLVGTKFSVVCNDSQTECPDGNTCCKLSSGGYGCCPLPQAVCCSDGVHCCPSGYTCDTSSGQCKKGHHSVAWVKKQPALGRSVAGQVHESVVCPGGEAECPDDNTCCKISSGQYGCCPLPNAVCCSDGIHCCPSGYTCDVAGGKCNKGDKTVAWLEKQPSQARKPVKESVVCPGSSVECGDGQTCCKLASGNYGCCPLPNAVCCADQVHCCPHGYTCDSSAGSCKQGQLTVPWAQKQPALQRKPVKESVVCPGSSVECGDGQTCCKLASGNYGCCPLPNAVCCADQVHCCPHGYTCDSSAGSCKQGQLTVPWVQKQPALQRNVGNVVCPDQKSECPDGNTCCETSSGAYGCCPQPDAVCCADKLHCCPHGYQCDTSSGKCMKGLVSMPWERKKPSLPRFP